MDYSSMRVRPRLPGIDINHHHAAGGGDANNNNNYDDDENHSVFDFPMIDPTDNLDDDDNGGVTTDDTDTDGDGYDNKRYSNSNGKKMKKKKKHKKKKKKYDGDRSKHRKNKTADEPPVKTHPYPSSISIHMHDIIHGDGDLNNRGRQHDPPAAASTSTTMTPQKGKSYEFRSPFNTPSPGSGNNQRGGNSRGGRQHEDNGEEDRRQPSSPPSSNNTIYNNVTASNSTFNNIFSNNNMMDPPPLSTSSSEVTKHYQQGQMHYYTNQLSSAANSYSLSIKLGLQEYQHRKEMIVRMTTSTAFNNNIGGNSNVNDAAIQRDEQIQVLINTLCTTHMALGKTLVIAGQYHEAQIEYSNALGILTTHGGKGSVGIGDNKSSRVAEKIQSEISRLDRALSVQTDRQRLLTSMEKLNQKLNDLTTAKNVSSGNNDHKKKVKQVQHELISTIKKLIRLERTTSGERSYAHAKLLLKLSKIKLIMMSENGGGTGEGKDDDDGLADAELALDILRHVLCNDDATAAAAEGGDDHSSDNEGGGRGSSSNKHTLIGAACTYIANIYERKVNIMLDKQQHQRKKSSKLGEEGRDGGAEGGLLLLSSECKSMLNKALELYAESLYPLHYKYNAAQQHSSNNDDGDYSAGGGGGRSNKHTKAKNSSSMIQPDVAEIYHKIAKLYTKKLMTSGDESNYGMAVDAYHRSLRAYYGADPTTTTTTDKSKSADHLLMYQEEEDDVHPNVPSVWSDLSQLHLSSSSSSKKKQKQQQHLNDAIYASQKCIEVSQRILKTTTTALPYNNNNNEVVIQLLVVKSYEIMGQACSSGGMERYDDAVRCYQDGLNELNRLLPNGGGSNEGVNNEEIKARLLHKLGMTYHQLTQYHDAKSYLLDALRTLRSTSTISNNNKNNNNEDSSTDSTYFPSLLADLGMVHISCGEYNDAMTTLRLSMKVYGELGISDYSTEVDRVRNLFKEASSRGLGGIVVDKQKMMSSPSATTTSSSMMETPRTAATSLTFPSTVPSTADYTRSSYGSSSSKLSGRGQLVTLLEELTSPSDESKISCLLSPDHTVGDDLLKKSMTSPASASNVSTGKQISTSSYEVQHLKSQLQDAQQLVTQYQTKLTQVQTELDELTKQKVLAATLHHKEIQSYQQANIEKSVLQKEVESLRKEVSVSENSYQELVKVIDEEKERLNAVHDDTVQKLQGEVRQLKEELGKVDVVENTRLKESLESKKEEVDKARSQMATLSKEVSTLKSTNLTLVSERDDALREVTMLKSRNTSLQEDVQRLTVEVANAKVVNTANSMKQQQQQNQQSNDGKTLMEIKRLQFELQQERSRRLILEASLQKELECETKRNLEDEEQPPPPQPAFAYPMMPFGFPAGAPAPFPPPPPPRRDNKTKKNAMMNHAKIKTLEIDLATERASKEMLNAVISDLQTTHAQEKEAMHNQYTSCVISHEQETSELLTELSMKTNEVDRLSHELEGVSNDKDALCSQLNDTTNELSDVKGQLSQLSCELSSTMEEKRLLSDTVSRLEVKSQELTKNLGMAKEELVTIKAELKSERETLRRKETEGAYLNEENTRLKKEYSEAITLFESEMNRAKIHKEELHNDVDRVQSELSMAKQHLKNVLSELEAAHRTNGALETDVQHLKLSLDCAQRDVRKREEQIHEVREQAKVEMDTLTSSYHELEGNLVKLQDVVKDEKRSSSEAEEALCDAQGKLSKTEDTIQKLEGRIVQLNETVDTLQMEKSDLESSKSDLEKLDKILQSIPSKLEAAMSTCANKGSDDTVDPSSTIDTSSPEDESTERSSESYLSHISDLLKKIDDHITHLNTVIKSRDTALEKSQWNLSSAAHDLDTLEAKNKKLKEDLKEMSDLQSDYDELLDHYEGLVEEKEKWEEECAEKEEKVKESLRVVQEERDLFESRLKEAVDDLEELECERDDIHAELDRVKADFANKETALKDELKNAKDEHAKKEGTLEDRIKALQTDNELIEKLELEALEYEAALTDKDEKLRKMGNELLTARAELDEVQLSNASEHDAALYEREKIKLLETELQMVRAELEDVRFGIAEMHSSSGTQTDESSLGSSNNDDGYPDLLPSEDGIVHPTDRQTQMNLFDDDSLKDEEAGKADAIQVARTATNPFDEESLEDSTDVTDGIPNEITPAGPFAQGSNTKNDLRGNASTVYQQEISALKARVSELECVNLKLSEEIALSREKADAANSDNVEIERERESLKEEIEDLHRSNDALTAKLDESREEVAVAATVHDNDKEVITSLQKALDDICRQVEELQMKNDSLKEELYDMQVSTSTAEEVALRSQVKSLQEQNEELSSQLAEEGANQGQQKDLVEEIASLKHQARALEKDNVELTAKLAQSEAKATEAVKAHESDQETIKSLENSLCQESLLLGSYQQARSDEGNLHQADLDVWKAKAAVAEQARQNDHATISSLQKALAEKENDWRSKVVELQESNAVLNRELSELSVQTPDATVDHSECNSKISSLEMDLQNALNNNEEKQIKHNLELATVKAEFHNAMNSLDELQKDNKKMKEELESISSVKKSNNDSRNFEKEMNAAHSRFVSMEKALEDRVSRLQKEKDKLVAEYNEEMINKEEEHTKTKIELSAWKLEMQNALNDIEALKKERDDLKAQVQAYIKSLEAVCMNKAELEEKMHNLRMK